ncbi:MAG: glycosyltransferase [Ignavibacteria bacterium]|nr:glycosyltransferase [Ignavibacteria bacterium]
MKNVLLITGQDITKSSGIIAFDVLNALKDRNNVKILTNVKAGEENQFVIRFKPKYPILIIIAKIIKNIEEKFRKRNPKYYMASVDMFFTNIWSDGILKALPFKPDIIFYLHPVNYLTMRDLHIVSKKCEAPLLIYMMDMAILTGGCHYAWDCKGYKSDCGKCPGLHSSNSYDKTSEVIKLKKKYIKDSEIYPVAASAWQWNQLNESSVFENQKKYKIMSPTNETLFYPGDKVKEREFLGIPKNKKIIFFGAVYEHEERKGFAQLLEIIKILYKISGEKEKSEIHFIIAGKFSEKFEKEIPFGKTQIGFLPHDKLSAAYRAADIYLNSSIEDSGPTMINQAVMSGTPVVCFEMGVAPDLVINGVTGFKVDLYDCRALAEALLKLLRLSEDEYMKMSENCRNLAVQTCSHKTISEEFQKIIDELT